MAHKPYLHAFEFDTTQDRWQRDLPDGDTIIIERKPKQHGNSHQVSLTLKAAESITWWKAITLHTAENNFDSEVANTQDSRHEDMGLITYEKMCNYFVVLSKAKAWGVHTNVYWIKNSYALTPDHDWHITWAK